MWEDVSSNKKTLKIVEESFIKLIEASTLSNELNDNYIRNVETGQHTLEKAYDAKLTVFMEAIEQKFNEKLLRITKSFDDKINNMKLIIGSLKIEVNDNYIRCVEEGKHTLEKGYDAKVAVFREGIEQTFNEKLHYTTKSSDDKINNVELMIGRFKIQVQRQLNNLINAN